MASDKFLTTWCVDAPIKTVFDVLHNSQAYPRWWKGVKSVEVLEAGAPSGGELDRFVWRSVLPYSLGFDLRPYLIEGYASGELEGVGTWRLYEGQGTAVVYDWRVRTTRLWMNALGPLARLVFFWNHDIVMRQGGQGLAVELGATLAAVRSARNVRFAFGAEQQYAGTLIAVLRRTTTSSRGLRHAGSCSCPALGQRRVSVPLLSRTTMVAASRRGCCSAAKEQWRSHLGGRIQASGAQGRRVSRAPDERSTCERIGARFAGSEPDVDRAPSSRPSGPTVGVRKRRLSEHRAESRYCRMHVWHPWPGESCSLLGTYFCDRARGLEQPGARGRRLPLFIQVAMRR